MKKLNAKTGSKKEIKGSTFIETLVAITILMYVLSGVLSMTSVQMKTNFNQINHTKAVKLAEEAIERMMREDFDTMTDEVSTFEEIAEFPQYSRTVTVTTVDAENKDIEVAVTWRERQRSGSAPIILRFTRTR